MNENIKNLLGNFNNKISIISDDLEVLKKAAKSLAEKVTEEKNANDNLINQFKKYETIESDIIKLNIGGSLFSTLKSTLTKKIKNEEGQLYLPNIFEALLNGLIKPKYDEQKALFIDRNPKYFENILDYLRMANTDSEFEISSEVNKRDLRKEALFYNIQGLVELIDQLNIESTILKENEFTELMNLCGFSKKSKLKIIYRGTRDGFSAEDFHSKCDNIPKTLTIIKSSNNFIFGGYTEQCWNAISNFKADSKAFIFSFNKKKKILISNENEAIYCGSNYGPTFGNGHDLHICSHSNSICQSSSNLSNSYKDPSLPFGSLEAQSFLAGSYNFIVSEIEIFSLN